MNESKFGDCDYDVPYAIKSEKVNNVSRSHFFCSEVYL